MRMPERGSDLHWKTIHYADNEVVVRVMFFERVSERLRVGEVIRRTKREDCNHNMTRLRWVKVILLSGSPISGEGNGQRLRLSILRRSSWSQRNSRRRLIEQAFDEIV